MVISMSGEYPDGWLVDHTSMNAVSSVASGCAYLKGLLASLKLPQAISGPFQSPVKALHTPLASLGF